MLDCVGTTNTAGGWHACTVLFCFYIGCCLKCYYTVPPTLMPEGGRLSHVLYGNTHCSTVHGRSKCNSCMCSMFALLCALYLAHITGPHVHMHAPAQPERLHAAALCLAGASVCSMFAQHTVCLDSSPDLHYNTEQQVYVHCMACICLLAGSRFQAATQNMAESMPACQPTLEHCGCNDTFGCLPAESCAVPAIMACCLLSFFAAPAPCSQPFVCVPVGSLPLTAPSKSLHMPMNMHIHHSNNLQVAPVNRSPVESTLLHEGPCIVGSSLDTLQSHSSMPAPASFSEHCLMRMLPHHAAFLFLIFLPRVL